jgi:hypothetical protein
MVRLIPLYIPHILVLVACGTGFLIIVLLEKKVEGWMNRDVVKLLPHDDDTLRKGQGDKRRHFYVCGRLHHTVACQVIVFSL